MLGTFLALDLLLFFVFFEVVLVPMWFVIARGATTRCPAAGCVRPTCSSSTPCSAACVTAARHPARRADRRHLRHDRAGRPRRRGDGPSHPGGRVPGAGPRVRGQDADVAAARLAARRAHRGPDGRLGAAGGRAAEDGHATASSASRCRSCPTAPQLWAPFLGALAVVGILYGSLACLAQRDLKRLIAFSSVGHMGFVLLGISTLTVDRHQRRALRQRRPRPDHRPAVLPGRRGQGPAPHRRPRPARRRALRADAPGRRAARLRRGRQRRPARAGRLLGRDAHPARRLRPGAGAAARLLPAADGPRRGRRGAHHDVPRDGRPPGRPGHVVPRLEGGRAAARRHHPRAAGVVAGGRAGRGLRAVARLAAARHRPGRTPAARAAPDAHLGAAGRLGGRRGPPCWSPCWRSRCSCSTPSSRPPGGRSPAGWRPSAWSARSACWSLWSATVGRPSACPAAGWRCPPAPTWSTTSP